LRWKLLIAASLLAAAAGAGAFYAAEYLISALWADAPGWADALLFVGPLGAIVYASIFVYRHTPRRRALQAALTALFCSLATAAGIFAILSALAPGV
jgi:hypothetical protein